nr:uncharacterized protein LOC123839816 [Mirounga angustirostris]
MGSTALLLVKLFAPNAEQMYLVNHLKDSPAEEKRNVLEENARRAHGDIQDLADLNSSKPEAVIIPEPGKGRGAGRRTLRRGMGLLHMTRITRITRICWLAPSPLRRPRGL